MKKVILYVMETALALLPIGDGLAAELSEEVRQVIIQATRAGASVEVGESKTAESLLSESDVRNFVPAP